MMKEICTGRGTEASEGEVEAATEVVGAEALLGERGGEMGQKMDSEACPM